MSYCEGKVVVVTGAGGRLCRQVAMELVRTRDKMALADAVGQRG